MIDAKLAEVRISKEDAERVIAKHLIAIRDLYHAYNPDGDYLSMTIWFNNTNGNDNGEWTAWTISANNSHYDEESPDHDHPINLYAHKDIKDAQYWACVTAEEDAEAEENARSSWGDDVMFDGTIITHRNN